MGNPTIYYYPDPKGSLVTIDLVDVSEVEYHQERNRTDSERLDFGIRSADFGGRHRVRIVRARFAGLTQAGEDLRAQLETLEAHLKSGQPIGFSEDDDKSFAAYMNRKSPVGNTILKTLGTSFYNSAATVAAGDYVTIQTANPDAIVEHARVSSLSASGRVVTLASGVVHSYQSGGRKTLVRWRGFWPVLKLPEGAINDPIITTDRRMNYTLDMTLVEDMEALFLLAGTKAEEFIGTQTKAGGKLQTLTSAIHKQEVKKTSSAAGKGKLTTQFKR